VTAYADPTERFGRLVAVPGLRPECQWSTLSSLAPAKNKHILATNPQRLLSS
jgi:hypothetical protein